MAVVVVVVWWLAVVAVVAVAVALGELYEFEKLKEKKKHPRPSEI